MITYSIENFVKIYDELYPLFQDHWKEIARHQDTVPLDPDMKQYTALQDMGALHTLVAREEGKIIGYTVYIMMPHLHYKQNMFAYNDLIYVDQAHRGSRVGYTLLKKAEEYLKDKGADSITVHMKPEHSFEGLLNKMGYNQSEILFEKWVGE